MTPEEYARIRAILDGIIASNKQSDAEEPERIRLKIETRMAIERLHRANVALREALPH